MWLKWTRWLPVYSWWASSISVHTSFKWGEMTRESITLFLGFENFCSWTLMNQQRHNTGRDPCSLWSRWWMETLDESLSIRGRRAGEEGRLSKRQSYQRKERLTGSENQRMPTKRRTRRIWTSGKEKQAFCLVSYFSTSLFSRSVRITPGAVQRSARFMLFLLWR